MIIPGPGVSVGVGVGAGVEQEGAAEAAGEGDGDRVAGEGDRRLDPRLSKPVYKFYHIIDIDTYCRDSPDSPSVELAMSTHCSAWSGVTLESEGLNNKLSSDLSSIFH